MKTLEKIKPSQKKASKSAKKTILQEKLVESAEMLVAGYGLLAEIAKRVDGEAPTHASAAEWAMLLASGALDGQPASVAELLNRRNVFALKRVLGRRRAEESTRQRLRDLPTIAEAEETIVDAKSQEIDASTAIEQLDIDSLDPATAKKVAALARALGQFQTNREEAESTLQLVVDLRKRMRDLAPAFLTNHSEGICRAIPGRLDLSDEKNELKSLVQTLSPENYNLSNHITNGLLDNFVRTHCPEAVLPKGSASYGLKIDRTKLYAGFDRLRTEYVPRLRESVKAMQAAVDSATIEAELPIEKWIDDGEITVEMLLE